jgi:hypothetical protein
LSGLSENFRYKLQYTNKPQQLCKNSNEGKNSLLLLIAGLFEGVQCSKTVSTEKLVSISGHPTPAPSGFTYGFSLSCRFLTQMRMDGFKSQHT